MHATNQFKPHCYTDLFNYRTIDLSTNVLKNNQLGELYDRIQLMGECIIFVWCLIILRLDSTMARVSDCPRCQAFDSN